MKTIFIVGVINEMEYEISTDEALRAFTTYEKAEAYRKEIESTYVTPKPYDYSIFYIDEVELEESK